MPTTISFIGAGNMAQAIISGLLNSGTAKKSICASAASLQTCTTIEEKFGILTSPNNQKICENAEVIVLAVKPQIIKQVAIEIRDCIKPESLVISLAAGITCASLQRWLGNVAVVRCMPNTPSAIQLGASGIYCNARVNSTQNAVAKRILCAIGLVIEVDDEDLINAVTAVSGSGPAYFFLFIESMIDAGLKMGLDQDQATDLALQTALGSAKLAIKSPQKITALRQSVTSPNGTTESAIQTFENGGLRDLVEQAMQACRERAEAISKELGN